MGNPGGPGEEEAPRPVSHGANADPGARRPARRSMSQALVRALPVLLLVLGTVYDLATPPEYSALPMYAAAPLIAAPLYDRWGTLVVSALACVGVVLIRVFQEPFSTIEGRTDVGTVVTVAFLSLLVNRAVQRGGAQLASAREIAEAAQRAVLPEPPERLSGLQIAVRYEAAQEGAFIGGDLYAVQETPHGVRMIVGDVRGKGMGAVATVAVLIGAFREAAEQEVTLEAVARRLEHALAREAGMRRGVDGFEGFTTAVLAEVVREGRVVRLLNRGHPGPLLLDGDGGLRTLAAGQVALPLGLSALGGADADRADEIDFPPGATLLFHTDGLLEARNEKGVFYDPVARLEGRVFPAPGVLLTTLVKEVRRHTEGGATDDMALLAVRRPVAGAVDADVGADARDGPGRGRVPGDRG